MGQKDSAVTLGLDHVPVSAFAQNSAVGESGRICTGVGSREHGKNGSGNFLRHFALKEKGQVG